MKRLGLTILCCFFLSGCIFDPVFDTSSWDAYQNSAAAIKAKLSNDDLRRLDMALRYLLVESMSGIKGSGISPESVALAASLTNPNAILAQLGPRINGSSAAAIIQNLSIRLGAEISASESMLHGVDNKIGAVEISSAKYYWKQSGYNEQPIVEFTVRNSGAIPISRVYFNGVLTSPNRSIPWVKQSFVQTFKGGLEPREKQEIVYKPRFDAWSDPQLKNLSDAELKVTVINFEDANNQKVTAIDENGLQLKRQVLAALR